MDMIDKNTSYGQSQLIRPLPRAMGKQLDGPTPGCPVDFVGLHEPDRCFVRAHCPKLFTKFAQALVQVAITASDS